MKRTLALLVCTALASALSAASSVRITLRGGMTVPSLNFPALRIDGATIAPATHPLGWQAALGARFSVPGFIHIATELQFVRQGYRYRIATPVGGGEERPCIVSQRLELPVLIGFNLSRLRIFGGPLFRLAHWDEGPRGSALRVRYNDADIALVVGVGIDLRRFFLDARYTTFVKGTTNRITYKQGRSDVRLGRNNVWTFSAGIYF